MEYTAEDFAAYNLQDRSVRSRVIFYFTDTDTITFDNDSMIVSWSISEDLTDSLDTPFDACCANSCTLTVYNRYTGTLLGQEYVEAPIFDPLQNDSVQLNLKFKIQVSALRKDATWTPWQTVGIFYTTEITINDDRTTATLAGDDKLALIFNKNIPALPVYRNMSYKAFLTKFCEQYKLPVEWDETRHELLKYAYISKTTKATIQGVVSGAAAVANIAYDDEDNEKLIVIPFEAFEARKPATVIDYSNLDAEEDLSQFYGVSYNKSLLSTNDNTRVIWYAPSVDEPSSAFNYSTTDLEDFTKNKDGSYSYMLSRTQSGIAPIVAIEYTSVVSPYTETAENFGVGILGLKNTQYHLTGHADENLAELPEDAEYLSSIYGRALNLESQMLPADVLEKNTEDMQNYLEIDMPYVESLPIANKRKKTLDTWTYCNLQYVSMKWRYNPYMPLASCVLLDTQIYDLKSFTGILWQQKISYTSGGLQSDAIVVNRKAFSAALDIYAVAGYQNSNDAAMSRVFVVAKQADKCGVWETTTESVDDPGSYTLVGKLQRGFTDAAITFDGTWSLNKTKNIYMLATEEVPWIFSVCGDALYGQYGPDGEYQLIDSEVRYCAAERGYYPEDYADLESDQGVVVAYIMKNGTVRYRTYAVTSTGKRWLAAEDIGSYASDTVKGIQLHRLNDYRMGIVVTTTTGTYWHITDRVYSQMAFRPESFKVQAPGITPIFHAAVRMDKVDATPQPSFAWAINAAKTQVTITSDATLEVLDNYALSENISGTANMPSIASVSCGNKTIVVNFTRAAEATFTMSFAGKNIRFAAFVPDMLEKAGGWVVIEPFSHEFEIFQTAETEEHFSVAAPQLLSMFTKILPIYTIAQQASEHFSVTAPILRQVSVEIKDAREKVVATESECFNVVAAQITNITTTIEGIGIVPM